MVLRSGGLSVLLTSYRKKILPEAILNACYLYISKHKIQLWMLYFDILAFKAKATVWGECYIYFNLLELFVCLNLLKRINY